MNMTIHAVDDEVLASFYRYHWPGNVRELKNAVETAYNHVSSTVITLEDIPDRIRNNQKSTRVSQPTLTGTLKECVDRYEKDIIENELEKANGVIAETARRLGLSKQSLKYKLEKYRMR
ncbi:helix-turn-helix domain-containing protein [Halalkalibacter krulwichiae]